MSSFFPVRVTLGFAVLTALTAPVAAAGAQVVGRMPDSAVLRDLNDGQRLGAFTGWLSTGKDPVGVYGHSAPIVGVRYDVHMSGPAYFSLRAFGVQAKHDVYDPNAPTVSRRVGTASTNQIGADAALQISLTGARAWHGLQPLVNLGFGFMAGVANEFDAGKYATGTSALYSTGLAARFPTSRNSELRADLSWLIYQVRYPQAFRTTSATGAEPLRGSGSLTPFTMNRAATLAWTWGVFR